MDFVDIVKDLIDNRNIDYTYNLLKSAKDISPNDERIVFFYALCKDFDTDQIIDYEVIIENIENFLDNGTFEINEMKLIVAIFLNELVQKKMDEYQKFLDENNHILNDEENWIPIYLKISAISYIGSFIITKIMTIQFAIENNTTNLLCEILNQNISLCQMRILFKRNDIEYQIDITSLEQNYLELLEKLI